MRRKEHDEEQDRKSTGEIKVCEKRHKKNVLKRVFMPFFSVIECVCVCVVWIVFHLFMCMIKEAVKKLFSQLLIVE